MSSLAVTDHLSQVKAAADQAAKPSAGRAASAAAAQGLFTDTKRGMEQRSGSAFKTGAGDQASQA